MAESGDSMALKKVRLFDIVGQDGELIKTEERVHKGLGMLHSDVAAAVVVYEVLRNDKGGTSGHKHVLNIYTREDFLEDVARGDINIEMR